MYAFYAIVRAYRSLYAHIGPGPLSTTPQLIDRDGDIRLFILRYIPVPDAELHAAVKGPNKDVDGDVGVGCHAVLHTLEPVPPSRHINDRPGCVLCLPGYYIHEHVTTR